MMRASQPVSINGIEFDALISEERELTAEVPEYVTETGYTVSDNIVLSPQTLQMTLLLSNTPVSWMEHAGESHVADIIAQLEELYLSRELVTVITTDKTYQNMAITSLGIRKNTTYGFSREIPISLKEVLQTEVKTTTIPDSYAKSGSTGANAGTAATTSVSSASSSVGTGSGNASGSSSGNDSGSGSSGNGSILYNAGVALGLIKD